MAELAAVVPVARSGLMASLVRVIKAAWGRQKIWPPTRRTFPLYSGAWVALFSIIYFGYMKVANSKEAEWERKRKREYAAASIRNLLKYEELRLQEAEEAKQEAADSTSPPITPPPVAADEAAAADAADAEDTAADEAAAGDAAQAPADVADTSDAKKEKKEKKKKKEAPDAKRMLDLLFDEVENSNITKIGVDASIDWYKRAVGLLKERMEFELREAIDKTRKSRGVMLAESNDPNVLLDMEEYKDGEKLVEKVQIVTGTIYKAFGRKLVDKALVKEAQAVIKEVATKRKAALLRIWRLFIPHAWRWSAGTLILMGTECAWGFLFGQMVSMTQLAYSIGPETLKRAASWTTALVVGFAFNWPLDNLGDTLVDGVESKMQLELRRAVMNSILAQDREYFDHHQSGVLQERLNKDTELLAQTIIQQPKNLISAITRVVTKSWFLYMCSPQLFWLGVSLPVPFCVLLNTLGWRNVRQQDYKIGKVNDQASASTAEILREISTVRQFGMEEEESRRYNIISSWREQLEFSMKSVKRITFYVMWMAFVASRIANTYWGIGFVADKKLDPATLVLAVYQFDGIVWGARQIVDLFPALAQMMQPLNRIATLLDTVPKIEPHPENPGLQLKPEKFNGRIEFRDVDFTYPSERQKQVLFGLSFVVEPCTKVAFVGKAGCGKSTSVTLIQRFYNAAKGQILLDDRPIGDYDVHHLRRNIGVVAQDNVLFSTSLYNNIVYGMGQGHLPQPTMEQVWAACDAANVTEFVHSFPNGLHTFIGEKGVKLSGGQKQRLAIARAVIRHPTILLLDEATSALDSVNEKEVQKALDVMLKLHSGVAICIAHRLTTIKNCDKIVVMHEGKKVEEGTHKELLAIPVSKKPDGKTVVTGYYHTMWDTQMGEDTFADPKEMSDDQLVGKLAYLETEASKLRKEKQERDLSASIDAAQAHES